MMRGNYGVYRNEEDERREGSGKDEEAADSRVVANVKDLEGFNNLIDEMKKVILEDMYQAKMDTRLGYSKDAGRPENSENYRNGWYHKFVKTKDGNLELVVPRDRKGEFEPQVITSAKSKTR